MTFKQNPGRWLAVRALQAFDQRGSFIAQELNKIFQRSNVEPRERRFATELANGIMRRRGTLDAVLASFVKRDRADVDDAIWLILQLGAYQLLFIPDIPHHAALHETVELCRRVKLPQARSFVNGTLRNIQRSIRGTVDAEVSLQTSDPTRIPILQLGDDVARQFVELDRPIFSLPQMNPRGYISQALSLPAELLERFARQVEDDEKLFEIALWFSTSGWMSLRVNPLKSSREQLLEILQTANIGARSGALPECIRLAERVNPVDLLGYAQGYFSVQDESAMEVVNLLNPQPGEHILDLCAAPGGKSTHMAERMQNQGRVLACDLSAKRLEMVSESAQRLGLDIIECQAIPETGLETTEQFDAVLLDVPCSNTGVLGKRPEARWRIGQESFENLIPLQQQLLRQALSLTKPEGRIVYSTCSFDQTENSDVVQSVLQQSASGWQLIEDSLQLPSIEGDGGYRALIRRPG